MKKKTILSLILVALAALSANARNINISGKVTYSGDKKPAPGVIVSTVNATGTKVRLAQTDDDGNYVVTADDEGILIFENENIIQTKTVNIDEQFEINVEVLPEAIRMKELLVSGKRGKKKSNILDDAFVEMEGNWAKIKRFPAPIPKWLTSEQRFIAQPALYNSTRDTLTYLAPRVFDGWRYASTQERMYDWNLSQDTLASGSHYYTKELDNLENNTIIIKDSLYVKDPTDVMITVVIQQVENYSKIVWGDTQQVALGTSNPFRFLKINTPPVSFTEKNLLYQDMPKARNTHGEMNLMFTVGKSNLDPELGNNTNELNALVSEVEAIEHNQGSKLREISIYGFASPEGSYENNSRLANARMKSALDFVKQSLNLKKTVKLNSEASVTPWSEIVKALRADSLFAEADEIQSILDQYTGYDMQFRAISKLPYYRPLLTDTYLPRMRRVNYTINYDFQRVLTDDEIREQYKIDPKQLTNAQIYRYYTSLDGQEKEDILRQTMKTHPEHWIAAVDLSKIMIEKDESPFDILAPIVADRKSKSLIIPLSLRYNYGIAAMMEKNYSLADSIFSDIDDTPETHLAKIYCDLMNGYVVDTDEIAKDNPLNQVLIFLKKKENEIAYALSKRLGNSAEEDYIKAMAANRVASEDENNYDAADDAQMYLESAIRKDHKLYETALSDLDVSEVLKYIQNIDEILSSPEETVETPSKKTKKSEEDEEEADNAEEANIAPEEDNSTITQQ